MAAECESSFKCFTNVGNSKKQMLPPSDSPATMAHQGVVSSVLASQPVTEKTSLAMIGSWKEFRILEVILLMDDILKLLFRTSFTSHRKRYIDFLWFLSMIFAVQKKEERQNH